MSRLVASEVSKLVGVWAPGADGEARKSQELTLALLSWAGEPFSRKTFTPGHITCTGVVLCPERKRVLLVHHNRLDRWLLPGGHCEPDDPSPSSVAHREVIEETGALLDERDPALAGIDVHPIPANSREPLHLHHDLIFAFQSRTSRVACSPESRAVVWCGLDEFDRYNLPTPIRKAASRALALI